MAYDPYAPCPCGSGKKLKFCCQAIAEDMERISRLMEDNQLRAALKQLELLDKRHPSSDWITTTRALVMTQTGESAAARDLLRPWLASHPESEFGTVLYAMSLLQVDGYDAAKKAIQRSIQIGGRKYPELNSGLAEAVGFVMESRRQYMAAREAFSLALRLAGENERQQLFIRILEFDNNGDVYYPLRSMHPLPEINVAPEFEKDYRRAIKLALIGSWDSAADQFTALAEKLPESGELMQSAGLCRAWDGDAKRAAEALHAASRRLTDVAAAVECETIAQLLDWSESSEALPYLVQAGDVASVSRLLSVLDEQPRLMRQPVSAEREDEGDAPTAIYHVLDRDKLADDAHSTLSLETVPNVGAHVLIYDAGESAPARLVINGRAGALFDEALAHFKTIAGDQVIWFEQGPQEVADAPQEIGFCYWNWSFPSKTSRKERLALARQQWDQIVTDRWPNLAQAALNGKTPLEAAADPELKIPTIAAVYVLDAFCQRRYYLLDVPALLARLGLDPLPELRLGPEESPNALSLMQLHRLNVPALTDQQLSAVVNRAMLTHHVRFLRAVLPEALRRPGCVAEHEVPRVYQTLIDLNVAHGSLAEALRWTDEARTKLAGSPARFEELWQWDLRELMLRINDPEDPGLHPLLKKFAGYYGPKIPQLRAYLEPILKEMGIASPWDSSGLITPDSAAGTSAGGVWTPEAETAATGGGKLWLPGQ